MNSEATEIRAQLEKLLFRYARLLDECRFPEWVELFSSDGSYIAVTRENFREKGLLLFKDDGRDALKERAAFVMGYYQAARFKTLHVVSNLEIESVSGDEAICNSYFVTYRSPWDGPPELYACGEYRDRLVKTDGGWKFRERLVIVDNGTLPQNFTELL
jgi:3-phenylpropionate/cinnamic acid dioxygenase small subunit